MGAFSLTRKGSLLIHKTPKLVVTVPAPQVSAVFDQCAELQGYKVAGSYAMSGRVECFDKMTEIARVSFRYYYGVGFATGDGNLSDDLEATALFVPNPPGFLRARTFFLGNPALPLESTLDGANYPLLDVCDVPIGTIEDKNVQRYSYTADCRAVAKYGYSTTVARHASISDDMITEHITQLLNTFYLTEQGNADLTAIEFAMMASWGQLAGDTINLPLGAFEPIGAPVAP